MNKSVPDYLNGQCHIFAIALNQLSQLPLVALIDWNEDMQSTVLVHAGVQDKENFIDFNGKCTFDDILDEYEHMDGEWTTISQDDLLSLGEGSKSITKKLVTKIAKALPIAAQALDTKPNLSHKP